MITAPARPSPFPARSRSRSRSPAIPHLFGIDDLDDAELERLTDPAVALDDHGMRPAWGTLSMLFEQPSLRTASGFAASGLRVGLVPVTIDARGHSVRADVDLADELRQLSMLSDCVIVRTHETLCAADLRSCRVPVINAGDGSNEHPSQALIDATTLRALGAEGKRVTLMGNLRDHRTQHSLARLLVRLGVELNFVSPIGMAMPAAFSHGARTLETNSPVVVDSVIANSDFLYLTPTHYWNTPPAAGKAFQLDLPRARRVLKRTAIVLHPLPRLGELDASIDHSPFDGYHRQLANANAVRTRLLAHLLNR